MKGPVVVRTTTLNYSNKERGVHNALPLLLCYDTLPWILFAITLQQIAFAAEVVFIPTT